MHSFLRQYNHYFLIRYPFAWATGLHWVWLFAAGAAAFAWLAPSGFWLIATGVQAKLGGANHDFDLLYRYDELAIHSNRVSGFSAWAQGAAVVAFLVFLLRRYPAFRVRPYHLDDKLRQYLLLASGFFALCSAAVFLEFKINKTLFDALIGGARYDDYALWRYAPVDRGAFQFGPEMGKALWRSFGLSAIAALLAYNLLQWKKRT